MKTNKKQLKQSLRDLKEKIASKCLDCACYQPREVVRCEIRDCPLFSNRPSSLVGLYALAKKVKKSEARNT